MASSYVNNLRLDEMATGDGSGTWGTTTNTNLTLIGEAFGYATKAIADASTATLTIPDGTETNSEPRAMYLKLTGGGQACTVTLAPNTASKVWIIENVTSYTLTFTQGSGANVAILAGETKMIATDGAGSGAVVYDVLTDLNLAGTTKTAALTNAGALSNQGTVTVGVDDTGYDVKFFGATSGAYMLWDESADDLKLVGAAGLTVAADIDVDGTANLDVVDIDGATQADGTITVGVDDTGYDVKFFGATSGAYMLWDESADDLVLAGAAGLDIAGDIDVDGTANLDVVDIDGAVDMASTLAVAGVTTLSEDVTLTGANANVVWDKSADTLEFVDGTYAKFGTGDDLEVYHNGSHSYIRDTGTGSLIISGSVINLQNSDNSDHIAVFTEEGSCALYYDDSKKIETVTEGVQVQGGVLFGSDTAAANALDDYEEGTFTPSYTVGGGGSVIGVTGTNVGTYTKVGRICTVGVTSNYVETSGTVTYYNLALPFTGADTAGGMVGGGFGQETGQSGHGMLIKVEDNSSNAIMWKYHGGVAPANSYFSLAFTYQTV